MPLEKIFSRRYSIFFFVAILLLVACTSISCLFHSDRLLVSSESDYEIVDSFAVDGTPGMKRRSVEAARSQNQEIDLWASWMGDDRHTGQLASSAFKAPAILGLFVAGYPNLAENRLFVEQVKTHEKLDLHLLRNPGERWIGVSWMLPIKWWGKKVRIVAVDNTTETTGWLGVSTPFSKNLLGLLGSQAWFLAILPIYSVHFLLFLLPGLLISAFVIERWHLNSAYTIVFSITVSAILGYLAFCFYLFNQYVGLGFSIIVLMISLGTTVRLFRNNRDRLADLVLSKDVLIPITIMFLVGLFYLSLLYVSDVGKFEPAYLAGSRFFESRPGDNVIPMTFANRLYSGGDPRGWSDGWLSSDRPPLQVGILLIQRPLMALTDLSHQTLGTIIQCSWIAAFWTLCRTVKLSGRSLAMVMAFAIFSGFFLFNSLYIWPKLLAGSLAIFAFSLVLEAFLARRSPTQPELVMAAVAFALALLSHGGAIFTLPAVFLLLLFPGTFPGIRRLLIAGTIFYLLLLPWSAYQKLYDPPGNRLMKMHLAGVHSIDERSSVQTIFDAYKSIQPADAIANKWENLKTVVGQAPLLSSSFSEGDSKVTLWRVGEREHVTKALGILNVGWLLGIVTLFWRDRNSKLNRKAIAVILGAGLIDLIVWSLVLFGPGQTTLTHSSYATMMLFFVGLSMLISTLSGWLSAGLFLIQIISFIAIWLVTTPPVPANTLHAVPNLFTIALAILLVLLIFKVLFRLSTQRSLVFKQ